LIAGRFAEGGVREDALSAPCVIPARTIDRKPGLAASCAVAVSGLTVLENAFAADYGFAQGALNGIVTHSGTNQLAAREWQFSTEIEF
jgi:hypothetical protein